MMLGSTYYLHFPPKQISKQTKNELFANIKLQQALKLNKKNINTNVQMDKSHKFLD